MKTGTKRVMKIVKKNTLTKEEMLTLLNEIYILQGLDHPNIVKIYEVFADEYKIYVVTEYLRGGELYYAIVKKGGIREREAAKIMK